MRNIAGIVILSLLAAGCSTGSLFNASDSVSSSGNATQDVTDRIAGFFADSGGTRPKQAPGGPPPPEDVVCPIITVREGASTMTAYARGEPTALNLRYQGTISRTARECQVVAGNLQMRVGVEGRIILGPAGGPEKIEVPLRFAVVHEGPQPQTILTKTYRVAVTIGPGESNVPFLEIDENLTFPMPRAVSQLEAYVVYVGYDPEALKKPAPRRRRSKRS